MSYDPLIFGKNDKEGIVSIEVNDSNAEIFYENKPTEVVSNRFWILANEQLPGFIKLKGDLHYKYGRQFNERSEFLKFRTYNRGKDIYSIFDAKEALMIKDGYTYFKGIKLEDVSVLSFDIETIGMNRDNDSKVLLISNTFKKNGKTIKKLFAYDQYASQGEFLEAWCSWVVEQNPSVLCGHNVFSFDLDYLNHVAEREGVTLNLGRNGEPIRFDTYESKFRKDQTQDYMYKKAHIYGREIVDTLFLSIKYDTATKKYESYGLKQIIKQEGLESKDRVFYDAQQIRFNYKNPIEWEKIKKYCEDDSDDALALYFLMAPSMFYTTQSVPKSYQNVICTATGSQINSMMVRSYLQTGYSIPKATMAKEYEGAISIGNPGIYNNVKKIDVSSLYPSIILQYEIFDKDKDPQANFLKIVQTLTKQRLEHKKLAKTDKYYDDRQQSEKIMINSAYGFLGTTGLHFNNPIKAAEVTRIGQEILKKSIEWSEKKGYTLVNADTDSISYCKADQSPFTKEEMDNDLNSVNSLFPEKIRFEDDGAFTKVIVLKAKNYALWDGTKLKLKGSAFKTSTKEPALKEFMKDIIQTIIDDKNDFVGIYNKYIREAANVTDIKRWAKKATLTETTYKSTRANETKVIDAVQGTEYTKGDKVYLFFDNDDKLVLAEKFNGVYNRDKMVKKVYDTACTFDSILPEGTFLNYSLKRNKEKLEELLNGN